MENLESSINQNQLALFNLLTPEQEEERTSTIKSLNSASQQRNISYWNKLKILLSSGFEEGVHFENDFKMEKVNKDVTLKVWDSNTRKYVEFDTNIDCTVTSGDIYLVYDNFTEKGIVKAKRSFTIDSGKIECYSLVNSYRFCKPKTILEKIELKKTQAINNLNATVKKKDIKGYIFEKYKALYPEAEIMFGTDYNTYAGRRYDNRYDYFDVLNIKFKSGSSVSLRIGSERDKEYIHKKYDAKVNTLTKEELMDMFNKQI